MTQQPTLDNEQLKKIINDLQEKCKFFHNINNNPKELFEEINKLKYDPQKLNKYDPQKLNKLINDYNTKLEKLINNYNTKLKNPDKGSTNFLRLFTLKALQQGKDITSDYVNIVKDNFINKKTEFFKKFDLSDDLFSFIENYQPEKNGNPFQNWKNNFNIFYAFFYDNETKKTVNSPLKKIGEILKEKLNLSNEYDIKLLDFNGSQGYGQDLLLISFYYKELENYKNSIQLNCIIKNDGLYAEVHKGDNVTKKIKDEYKKEYGDNYLKQCSDFNEVIKELKKHIDKVNALNEDIIKNNSSTTTQHTQLKTINTINTIKNNKYTDDDFLKDVFLDKKEDYNTLKELLTYKKNIILQGPPGVGKTFIAKRLAYAILGEKDEDKIQMVQFHQSYGYEDFILGYRPNGTGFELKTGPFYEFCKKAINDPKNKYFFIIDEINRGKISKIFGELLMLIENDKRGEMSLPLLYSNQEINKDFPKGFTVPKNLYIIGMMNTADRSIALIDYALRRRFAFYDIKPAFENAKFNDNINDFKHTKLTNIIDIIKKINEEILKEPTLGEGFQIGHSYFCSLDQKDIDNRLTQIVKYEIIPLLKEYYFDKPEKLTNEPIENLTKLFENTAGTVSQ